jgi:hypothetical protein
VLEFFFGLPPVLKFLEKYFPGFPRVLRKVRKEGGKRREKRRVVCQRPSPARRLRAKAFDEI